MGGGVWGVGEGGRGVGVGVGVPLAFQRIMPWDETRLWAGRKDFEGQLRRFGARGRLYTALHSF